MSARRFLPAGLELPIPVDRPTVCGSVRAPLLEPPPDVIDAGNALCDDIGSFGKAAILCFARSEIRFVTHRGELAARWTYDEVPDFDVANMGRFSRLVSGGKVKILTLHTSSGETFRFRVGRELAENAVYILDAYRITEH